MNPEQVASFDPEGSSAIRMWGSLTRASFLRQPDLRVYRCATAPHFEIERRLIMSTGVADRADHVPCDHRLADLPEQLLVVAVKAHVTTAVVEHQHEAHAWQPVPVHHLARERCPHSRPALRPDQHALPFHRAPGARLAEPGHDLTVLHRPGQLAFQW